MKRRIRKFNCLFEAELLLPFMHVLPHCLVFFYDMTLRTITRVSSLKAYRNEENAHINLFDVFPDGGWGTWGAWGSCSVTCGSGNQTRTRLCNAPPPSLGGSPCSGSNSISQPCNTATACIVSKYSDSARPTVCIVDLDKIKLAAGPVLGST